MFEAKALGLLYCMSPLHMGTGAMLGPIDNPIQRERHTGHPSAAGSGIKGALRHTATMRWKGGAGADDVRALFGPDTDNASEHAGALSFSDAQIVLFPVRSLRASYVYATCPTALARLQRLCVAAGIDEAKTWQIPEVATDGCVLAMAKKGGLVDSTDHVVLETFRFEVDPAPQKRGQLLGIADWLAQHALPSGGGYEYFSAKIRNHTVLLSDARFNHFVQRSTMVEPHVRINDETGTADEGGLFYTECLPPESVLAFLAAASAERREREKRYASAQDVLDRLTAGRKAGQDGSGGDDGFDGALVQMGGDATTGRGQVIVRFVRGATEAAVKESE